MRSLMFLGLVACSSTPPLADGPPPGTVLGRLASPTRLLVAATQSTGTITASHDTHDGWQAAAVAIAIANGELDATADDALHIAIFAINAAPIDIPADVFGTAAQLRDVQLALATPATLPIEWSDDNHATVTAMLELDLAWSIAVDGNVLQLGTQHLPPLAIAIAFSGAGEHVDASIVLDGAGTLWSWADLLELAELQLTLTATTTP